MQIHMHQLYMCADSLEKTLMLGKIEGRRGWGQQMTEDEMVGWHYRLNGHGFGWTLRVGDGQGGLVCCSSWGRKELDTTERMKKFKGKSLSPVQPFATPWTVAYQASLSMGFSRQEYWSGLPFPSPMHQSEK